MAGFANMTDGEKLTNLDERMQSVETKLQTLQEIMTALVAEMRYLDQDVAMAASRMVEHQPIRVDSCRQFCFASSGSRRM